jgi:endonuclease YncB( thermonuclease family)
VPCRAFDHQAAVARSPVSRMGAHRTAITTGRRRFGASSLLRLSQVRSTVTAARQHEPVVVIILRAVTCTSQFRPSPHTSPSGFSRTGGSVAGRHPGAGERDSPGHGSIPGLRRVGAIASAGKWVEVEQSESGAVTRLKCGMLCLALLALLAAPNRLHAQPAQVFDCTGFDSWEWAQSVYERQPGRDAIAAPQGVCPTLPHGAAPALWTTALPQPVQAARVVAVSNGDTLAVQLLDDPGTGTTEGVRLLLIDTPATTAPTQPAPCFAAEATTFTSWLVSLASGGTVYLQTDHRQRDQNGRLLRYVWLEIGGLPYLLNEALIRSGYGTVNAVPPDVQQLEMLTDAQRFARAHGLGLWSACGASLMPDGPAGSEPPARVITTPSVVPLQVSALQSPGPVGSAASLALATRPGAVCTIVVVYDGVPSQSPGLEPQTADATGAVSWSWVVDVPTRPVAWAITATCEGQTLSVTVQTVTGAVLSPSGHSGVDGQS